MSDESLTRIYQRLGRVEDKLDEVLELLRKGASDPTFGGLGWKCPHCPNCANANKRENCMKCGRPRGAPVTRMDGSTANWTCETCSISNTYNRGNCVGCGAIRACFG